MEALMELGKNIALLRKEFKLTQAELAEKLNVSYQAISQWERGETFPDVTILPELADIFDVTTDSMFGRENEPQRISNIPDDNVIRAVILNGNKVVSHEEIAEASVITFKYDGPARNIESKFSIQCGNVAGSVEAGTHIICGDVGSYVDAGEYVMCGNINSYVDAGTYVSCSNIGGYVDAQENVTCDNISGDVKAAGNVKCGKVDGNVSATVVLQYKG